MNMNQLSPKEREYVRNVMDWVNRMSARYGTTVNDKEGNEYDWGQALCRECYGPDWVNYMQEHNIRMPSAPEAARAATWEDGDIPDWVVYSDEPVEEYDQYKFKEEEDNEYN